MTCNSTLALAAVLSLVSTAASTEEAGGGIEPGNRVRLTVAGRSQPVVGRFESETEEEFVIRSDSERHPLVRVPRADIDGVEVARSRGSAATIGILAAAAATGAFACARNGSGGETAAAAGLGAVLALPGAAVGARSASHGGSVLRGALLGAAASGALGLALGLPAAGSDGWFSGPEVTAAATVAGVVVGAVSGAVAAAVGQQRWTPVRSRSARVTAVPLRHGAAMQVAVSF